MSDNSSSSFTAAMAALEQIESEQKARFAPKPPEPQALAQEYAAELAAARGPYRTIDASWLTG